MGFCCKLSCFLVLMIIELLRVHLKVLILSAIHLRVRVLTRHEWNCTTAHLNVLVIWFNIRKSVMIPLILVLNWFKWIIHLEIIVILATIHSISIKMRWNKFFCLYCKLAWTIVLFFIHVWCLISISFIICLLILLIIRLFIVFGWLTIILLIFVFVFFLLRISILIIVFKTFFFFLLFSFCNNLLYKRCNLLLLAWTYRILMIITFFAIYLIFFFDRKLVSFWLLLSFCFINLFF